MTPARTHDIGVALLGFGFAGRIFHAPFIATTPGLALRMIASSRRDEIAAAYPGVRVSQSAEDALASPDVDLVVVATTNETHAPFAQAAMRAGKHVVVDKPFTLTLDEARRVVATAEETRRLLAVFQNRRWDSDFAGVRAAIAAGAIGEVTELWSEIARWRPEVRDRWRERPGPGAGLWFDLGPHLIDQALELFGLPDAVHAAIRPLRPGATVDDWFHVRLVYASREVWLTSSMLAADPTPRFVVRGTTGTIVKQGMDPQERALMAGQRPGESDWGHDPDPVFVYREGREPERRPAPPGHYGHFYARMRDAIREGAAPPVTARRALEVMAVTMAGFASASSGEAAPVSGTV
ncbi:oxidoreductase [Luteitalea sp. TBR-22]|uniref:oxidoreductase n=1 Tax=Luteitalea sp. TBR-22 TaxID=2802971 RepID=UPI001AF6415F|nr:oxidoreductase [Luteitalea sp. TBR-22]BCS32532.1 oxidoreductase [Luteitalea sp. TBR-22]